MSLLHRACKSVSPYYCFNDTYVCMSYVNEIFIVKEWRDFETGGRGRSRSWKMAPFGRSHTTFCWSAIVTVALSGIVF